MAGALASRDVVGIDHKPTELPPVRPPLAALHSPLVYSGKGWLWCSALPFTTVEDDPYIAPVLEVLSQLFVPVQTGAGHDKYEHVANPTTDLKMAHGGDRFPQPSVGLDHLFGVLDSSDDGS
jgi:hypothetical protein